MPGGTTKTSYNDADGVPAVVTFSIAGMAHGLAVDPGSGVAQCGSTATYFLDAICSSYHTAEFFGLNGSGSDPSPTPSPTRTSIPTPTVSSTPTVSPTLIPTPSISVTDSPANCFTTDNYHQVLAGRAHQSLGRVSANGSNQAMGLYSLAVVHTLKQTGSNNYVIADNAC